MFGQGRQSFVYCGPRTEVLKARRTSFAQRFFQTEHAFVIDIVVEVNVHSGSLVVKQEPSGLGKAVTVCVPVNQHRSDGQRSL